MIILQKLFLKIYPFLKILNPIPLATTDNLSVRQKLFPDRHFITTEKKEGQVQNNIYESTLLSKILSFVDTFVNGMTGN